MSTATNDVNNLDGLQQLVDINKILDDKAYEQGITWTTLDPDQRVAGAISTGLLSFDLIMGGGYAPGRFSYLFGPSGSCKSTTMFHTIKEAIDRGTLVVAADHEASFDPSYLKRIGIDWDAAIGSRNRKGEWLATPKLRYCPGKTAQATFRLFNAIMKQLPDKISLWDPKAEINRYFLVSPKYEKFRPTWKSVNEGLRQELIQEVEDFTPQMMFIIDSLKAMLPEAQDEDPDKEPIAMLARAFSSAFPLVKSLLAQKNCLLISTNHLTINPMARFGNPETEPGGQAVQFYPDFKMKLSVNRAKSKIDTEKHVSGSGEDRYLFGRAQILKNKSGPCFREMEYRVWVDENSEPGRGIDPVYDTYSFLENCGLMVETSNNTYQIRLEGFETESIKWAKFKELILLQDEGKKLRAKCHELVRSGKALDLYYQYLRSEGKEASGGGSEDEEDDEAQVTEI